MKKITVKIKSVYGVDKIYPACEYSQIFCKLVRQSTLTQQDINYIKALGYEIQLEQKVITL